MNIYCRSDGVVFHVDPERIFQGSVGANVIRFIGAFPSSAQVLMAYKLPNGVYKSPKMLTPVAEFEQMQSPDGVNFSVWEGRIGATPKLDSNGNLLYDENTGMALYDLDYSITENYGDASITFYVYGAPTMGTATNGQAVMIGNTVLATATVNFEIEKGVPVIAPNLDTEDSQALLTQMLGVLSNTQSLYNAIESDVEEQNQAIQTLQKGKVSTSDKGVPNGVASLDENGKVPKEQLPEGIGGGGSVANMEEGKGKGSVQQVAFEGYENGFDFTGRNENAEHLDPTLSGNIPYGATGSGASTFGGKNAALGAQAFAVGNKTIAKGEEAFAQGYCTVALGNGSAARGSQTVAYGEVSSSSGRETAALGIASEASGTKTVAVADSSHTEGDGTSAYNATVHTVVYDGVIYTVNASAYASHAEGVDTHCYGGASHAQGIHTHAIGDYSHASGRDTIAYGEASSANGRYTFAGHENQFVVGRYNENYEDSIFEVGNGDETATNAKASTAFRVLIDGRAKAKGEPKDDDDVVRLKELKAAEGGGGGLYVHTIYNAMSLSGIKIKFYSTQSEIFTVQSLKSYLYSRAYLGPGSAFPVMGYIGGISGSFRGTAMGIYVMNDILHVCYVNTGGEANMQLDLMDGDFMVAEV